MSAFSLFHSSDGETLVKYMGTPGNTRLWLTEGKTAPLPSYATEEVSNTTSSHPIQKSKQSNNNQVLEVGKSLFGSKDGGYAAPINYYRASLNSIGADEYKSK